MRIVECSKSNWSGETIKVRVTYGMSNAELRKNNLVDCGVFEVNGDRFRLDVTVVKNEGTDGNEEGRYAILHYLDKSGPRQIAKGYQYEYKGKKTWEFISGEISRESENPYVAAIQIVCNIF